jgi:hypothetical protein
LHGDAVRHNKAGRLEGNQSKRQNTVWTLKCLEAKKSHVTHWSVRALPTWMKDGDIYLSDMHVCVINITGRAEPILIVPHLLLHQQAAATLVPK